MSTSTISHCQQWPETCSLSSLSGTQSCSRESECNRKAVCHALSASCAVRCSLGPLSSRAKLQNLVEGQVVGGVAPSRCRNASGQYQHRLHHQAPGAGRLSGVSWSLHASAMQMNNSMMATFAMVCHTKGEGTINPSFTPNEGSTATHRQLACSQIPSRPVRRTPA